MTLREAITSINNQADVNADVTLARVGNYASLSGGTPDVINFNIAGAGRADDQRHRRRRADDHQSR